MRLECSGAPAAPGVAQALLPIEQSNTCTGAPERSRAPVHLRSFQVVQEPGAALLAPQTVAGRHLRGPQAVVPPSEGAGDVPAGAPLVLADVLQEFHHVGIT